MKDAMLKRSLPCLPPGTYMPGAMQSMPSTHGTRQGLHRACMPGFLIWDFLITRIACCSLADDWHTCKVCAREHMSAARHAPQSL